MQCVLRSSLSQSFCESSVSLWLPFEPTQPQHTFFCWRAHLTHRMTWCSVKSPFTGVCVTKSVMDYLCFDFPTRHSPCYSCPQSLQHDPSPQGGTPMQHKAINEVFRGHAPGQVHVKYSSRSNDGNALRRTRTVLAYKLKAHRFTSSPYPTGCLCHRWF